MLLLHVRFAREDAAKRGASLTVPELADTLRRLGYAVKMRTALGGGSGGACLRSLRHSFLTVSVAGPAGALSYVLDPRFREQVGPGSALHAWGSLALWMCWALCLLAAAAVGPLVPKPRWSGLAVLPFPASLLGGSSRFSMLTPPTPCSLHLQFEIAHATPRYSRVLSAVSPEVVSSQDRLNKVGRRRAVAAAAAGAGPWLPVGDAALRFGRLLLPPDGGPGVPPDGTPACGVCRNYPCSPLHAPRIFASVPPAFCLTPPPAPRHRLWSCSAPRWPSPLPRLARRCRPGASTPPC